MTYTAIVIDEEKDHLDVFRELLEFIGIEVVDWSTTTVDLVSLFRTKNTDLVFLDVAENYHIIASAIEGIKKINSQAKIVATTADVNPETMKLLEEKQVSAILVKPFTINSLVQTLQDELKMKISIKED